MSDYRLFSSPVGFDFREMSKRDARAFFEHFVSSIPERVRMLEAEIRRTPGFEAWSPDHSDVSLVGLSLWLTERAAKRVPTDAEVKAFLGPNPGPLQEVLAKEYFEFTVEAYSYCIDGSLYLGRLLCARNREVEWQIGPRPRNDVHFNRPVIGQIEGDWVVMEPLQRVVNCVHRLLRSGRRIHLEENVREWEWQIDVNLRRGSSGRSDK